MPQYLYLVRHAHALDDAPSDELRPLSPKGHKQCQRLVRGLSPTGLVAVDTLWHSGLLRARETAEALVEGLQLSAPMTRKKALAPAGDPAAVARQLNALSVNCLVAGHEPNLSFLASLLLAGHTEFQRLVFAKASILCLSRLNAGNQSTSWQIEWHLHHKCFK